MKKIKVGSFVLVKHSHSINSPVSAHKTHEVIEITGNQLRLAGFNELLPINMFEAL